MPWEAVHLVYKLKSNQNLMSMDSCTSGWGSWKKKSGWVRSAWFHLQLKSLFVILWQLHQATVTVR